MRNTKKMRLKLFFLLLIGFCINNIQVHSQTVITLTQPENGIKEHEAQYNVDYQVGYSYSPTQTEGMHGFINPALPVNTPFSSGYGGTSDISNRSLDYNLTVGSIAGDYNVTSTGGASYSIPILVPKGSADLEPSIALTYNSQSNFGIAGMGWSIAGLSSITRIPKTYYYNNYSEGIDLTANDDFAINGNRFVLSGNSAVVPKEAPMYKITPNGNIGGSPEWYMVEVDNGLTMEFGRSSDSRFMTNDNSKVILWNVNKVYDKYGNYIEFKYNNGDRHPRIEKILYTGNTTMGLTPYNEINFYYNSLIVNDQNETFIAGSSVKSKFILRSITTKTHGTIDKEYLLSYTKNLYPLLQSISLKGRKGDEYNPTLFQYGDNVLPAINESDWQTISGADVVSAGDFNGDGKSDIIKWDRDYINFQANFSTWTGYVSNGNGTFSQYIQGTVPPGYWKIDDNSGKLSVPGRTFDFNGDGKTDILLSKLDIFQQYIKLEEIIVEIVNAQNNTSPLNVFSGIQLVDPEKYIYTGDFDGDRRDEIILFSRPSQNSNYNVDLIDYDNGSYTKKPISNSSLKYLPDAEKVHVIDLDGDGKLELMMIFPQANGLLSSCEVFELSVDPQNGNISSTRILYSGVPGYPTKYHEIYPGDFNGDGKTDVLTHRNGNWQLGISDGLDFIPHNINSLNVHPNNIENIEIADYNGDGKSDVYYFYPNFNTNNDEFDLYLSLGNDFSLYEHYTTNVHLNKIIAGDFNGDGKQEIFDQPNVSTPTKIFTFYEEGKEWLLHKVSDGMGRLVAFQYDPLTKGGTLYAKGNSSTYPFIDIQYPINVVKKVKTTNGIGGFATTNYSYKEAIANMHGRGLLGFTTMTQSDQSSQDGIISTYDLNTTYARLLPESKQIYSNIFSTPDITEVYNYTVEENTGTGIIWNKLNSIVKTDNLIGYSSTSTNTWDINTRSVVSSTTTKGNSIESKTKDYTYITHSSYNGWRWQSLQDETTTLTRIGNFPIPRKVTYSYNATGKMTQQVDGAGNVKTITTSYNNINGFGLAQNIITSTSGAPSRTRSLKYDAKGRFVEEETNSLNQKTIYSYNQILGVVKSQIGIDGLQTKYEHDGFGRITKVTTPDALVTTNTIDWFTTSNSPYALYAEITQQNGASINRTIFDLLGREVETQTEAFNGATIYTNTSYDVFGNVLTTTLPYTQSQSPVVSTRVYDGTYNDRLLSITNSAGNTNFSYNLGGGNVSINTTYPDNTTKLKVTDCTGKLIQADDNGGSLTYTYTSLGQTKEVKLNGLTITQMVYDNAGYQTKLIDNNAGTTEYEYNGFGELTKQTDANGSIFEMSYDVLGRMLAKQEKGASPTPRTITYNYVQNGNGINQLQTVSEDLNNTSNKYEYDYLNRITKMTETIDATDYETSYTYDAFNNIKQTHYPSGTFTENEYNSLGYLTKVKLNNNTIWEGIAANAFGQYTNMKYGNVFKTKTYDQYGFPVTEYAEDVGNNAIQDLTYNFDVKNGNLLSRNDGVHATFEEFNYDNLNRLTETKVNGNAQITTNFATNGNISDKSDAGNFTYDNNKVNALIGVSTLQSTIGLDQQDILYTGFNSPYKITEGTNTLDLYYGVNEQRKKAIFTDGTNTENKYYLGNYELIENPATGDVTELHYIAGGDGLAVVHVIQNVNNQQTTSTYFTYTDHLGSILSLSDENGTIATEQNFDAWGRYRDPQTLSFNGFTRPYNQQGFEWLKRGYTGHEYLPNFELINMNGRVYDPIVGRMLSVDNYVQDATSTQAYNRYSYVINNPLKYTDPSGEIVWGAIIGAAAFGAYSGGVLANNDYNLLNWDYSSSKTWKYAGMGMIAAGIGSYVGLGAGVQAIAGNASIIEAGIVGTGVSGIVSGGLNGIGNTLLNGGSFSNALGSGTFGATIGGFTGALSGGLNAKIGNFTGVTGNGFKNIAYEIGHSTFKGSFTGFANGGLMYAISKDDSYLWKQTIRGAFTSLGFAGGKILALGSAFIPNKEIYGDIENFGQTYRKSFFMQKGTGITLGNNVSVRLTSNQKYNKYLLQHETGHLSDINNLGALKFYSRILGEYFRYGMSNTYSTPGTLEHSAERYAFGRVGYYFNANGINYTSP